MSKCASEYIPFACEWLLKAWEKANITSVFSGLMSRDLRHVSNCSAFLFPVIALPDAPNSFVSCCLGNEVFTESLFSTQVLTDCLFKLCVSSVEAEFLPRLARTRLDHTRLHWKWTPDHCFVVDLGPVVWSDGFKLRLTCLNLHRFNYRTGHIWNILNVPECECGVSLCSVCKTVQTFTKPYMF